jgi:glycosyltransferase involved in cell wall biosynthesis
VSSGVSVVVPSIPPRAGMLQRALASIWAQEVAPDAVIVTLDTDRRGAPYNRDAGLAKVDTEYVAFLDDDDELYPQHLRLLLAVAAQTGADLVYPWFDVLGGTDPFAEHFGQPWSNDAPHQVPVTFLARTVAVRDALGFSGGWDPAHDPGIDAVGNRAGEDWQLILRLCKANARIVHLPERTWAWHHHGANTSGLPSRW